MSFKNKKIRSHIIRNLTSRPRKNKCATKNRCKQNNTNNFHQQITNYSPSSNKKIKYNSKKSSRYYFFKLKYIIYFKSLILNSFRLNFLTIQNNIINKNTNNKFKTITANNSTKIKTETNFCNNTEINYISKIQSTISTLLLLSDHVIIKMSCKIELRQKRHLSSVITSMRSSFFKKKYQS